MSQRSYCALQSRLKSIGCRVLPSYHDLLKVKKDCYPNKIEVTEVSAEVNLMELLSHTIHRICAVQNDVLLQVKGELNDIECIFKWGCDGSSGYSVYKQRFSQRTEDKENDSSIFVISLVPLQLYNITNENNKQILWQNTTPSSTRYCRPLKLLLKSESDELIKTETAKIRQQIENLNTVNIQVGDKEISVKSKLIFSMVDGKICNSEMNMSSSQKCYICGCGPKDMNNTSTVTTKVENPESYQFGLSPLHAKIRSFECLLKISYRLGVNKWQIRNAEDKQKIAERKKLIQEQFRNRMGLLVDVVKVGYGTTNDGNTSRRFFNNPSLSASITGLDEMLIKHFSVLLQALSCGYEIDADAFDIYARKTLDRYLELYPWYCMPVTVHKLLVHGSSLIKYALLPIGQLSEDAQECRHKEIKHYREHSTRKFDRKATMEDLIHILLLTSDPVITSYRRKNIKPLKKISPGVLSLLKAPTLPMAQVNVESSDNSSSECLEDYSEDSSDTD